MREVSRASWSGLLLLGLLLWQLAQAAPAPLAKHRREPAPAHVVLCWHGTAWDVTLAPGGAYRAVQLRGGGHEDWWAPIYVGTWRPGDRPGLVTIRERYAGTRATPTDWVGPYYEFTAGPSGPVRLEPAGGER